MARALVWLAAVALAVAGQLLDEPSLRAACVPGLLLALALAAPALRGVAFVLAAAAVLAIGGGRADALLAAAPALLAALIGWLFLRTLRAPRVPLIARLIVAVDGAEMLRDAAIARYARRLTWTWAVFQFALALIALAAALPRDASVALPHWFGFVVLPAAIGALLLLEFGLRPWLLPQAPRRSLAAFLAGVVRAWPAALRD